MSEVKKINLSQLKNTYKKGILIPEIQRDYVMGAGGKSANGSTDKLTGLLDAILASCKEQKDFDFSCIITFCRDNDFENNYLEIYDGQQRLTTLILLVLYRFHQEDGEKYKDYENWYSFRGRDIANKIVDKLTSERFDLESVKVKDFTSFSMKNLLKKFGETKYECITSDYLLHHVKFDRVEIGSQNEIEQFFMDLNSGVKLKEYELYKAKLVHHINQLLKTNTGNADYCNVLKEWPHRLDNEWLDAFKPFADFLHPAEEYEVAFIKYCFKMLCDNNESENRDGISGINLEALKKCFLIMNSLSKLNFSTTKKVEPPQIVEFSWGNDKDCARIRKDYNFDKRGAYWNLKYENSECHLYYVIQKVLLNKELNEELYDDLIIWAYITTLEWQIDYQNEYIRILKILLNHNTAINSKAWYECQGKGQYLYYSKYCVCDIPQYYGEHLKIPSKDENKNKHERIWSLVKYFGNKKSWERLLNKKNISEKIMDEMLGIYEDNDGILKKRKEKLGSFEDYNSFCNMENDRNGILVNFEENKDYEPFSDTNKDKNARFYLTQVDIEWPTRGDRSTVEDCWVLLKCDMDKLYDGYNEGNDRVVKRYVLRYEKYEEFDKEKCFWLFDHWNDRDLAYRIMDRITDTSKTYIAKGGTDNYYWAYEFDGENAPKAL